MIRGVLSWPHEAFQSMDRVLRNQPNVDQRGGLPFTTVLGVVVGCGVFYGALMGTYGWVVGARPFVDQSFQMVYSAIKVPLLLLLTTAVSLPSFFVLNTLFGVRDDFDKVIRAIVSVQAGLTIILSSLAPITLFFYFGCENSPRSYHLAILLNALMFGIASVSAQWLLRVYYRPLIRKNPIHRVLLRSWIGVYAFVGVQCGWTMRPFIGNPKVEATFFRENKFGNAYVELWEIVLNVIF